MNAKDLYLAVGEVDDDLILSAQEPPTRKKRPAAQIWAAAACLCLLCLGALLSLQGNAVVWNPAEDAALTKIPAPADSTVRVISQEELAAYYQLDAVPESLGGTLSLSPSSFLLCVDTAGTPVYDCNQLLYQDAERQRSVNVTLSRLTRTAEAPEASEKSAQTLPGADCFAVVPESITRVSADFQLTCEEDAPLALRSEYWLETQTDGEWQPLDAALLKTQEQADEAAPEAAVCTLHYDWQTLYGELDAGEYRLAQPVILPDGSDYTLYAEFTVE